MSKFFAVFHVIAVLALALSAVFIWRLRCESFGCMGVGVAWFAWGLAFFPVLAIGGALCSRSSLGVRLRKLTRLAVWAQVVLGLVLLGAWVCKNAV
ncbi:hypothetical protein [Niveibacterium terrae]|uniref:hypothetical protein n=1 Tax=Niveibacterium terrae TaxID=3373598 RepID=UPI003A8FFF85